MGKPLHVLIVEDSEDDALLLVRHLERGGFEPAFERVETAEAMNTALGAKSWDVILCDFKLPEFTVADALVVLKKTGLDLPFIVVSGTIGEERAADLMRAGAHDLILKDNLARLVPAISREIVEARERLKRRQAEEALQEKTNLIQLLQTIAVASNEAATIDEAMQICIDAVCAHTGWPVGHAYWLSGDDTGELAPTKIWHLDRPRKFAKFRRVTQETRFAPGVGLPGRVLQSGEPAWIVDVTKDRNFPRAKLAKDIGVKAGFAFPIWAGKEVVAVLEFFSAEAVEPDPALLEVMAHVGVQLSRVIEREQAEAALRESESRFRNIADAASDWFWEMGPDLRFTYHSDRYFEVTGFSPEEKIGTTRTQYVGPSNLEADTAKWDAHFADLAAHRPFKNFEYTFTVQDGSRRHVRISGVPVFDTEGKFHGYRGTGTDITDRKSAEAQLQQAQKMEAVGELTGGIAHDFNNLLTVILGNLQLLERRIDGDERIRKRIEAASSAAKRGADLTKRLLAFSRRQVLEPEVIDLERLIRGMEDLFLRTLGETIDIRTVIADDMWQTRVDPSQLESALLNLAINARDAMPDGGKLTIETANVYLDEEYVANHAYVTAGDYVMLAVTDTGCGMSPAVAAQVFQPFFTTKDVGKGTGLGLSMVYGFVKQSGGHVNVYSEEGHGTTVKIYLTRLGTSDAAAVEGPTRRDDMPTGDATILVAEDDAAVRETAVAMLQELGYRVLEAKDGPAALAVMDETEGIDLLLSDVVMPGGMNGPALARLAKQRHPHIKVLFASGYAADAIVRGGTLDEGVELIGKPYSHAELARKVRQVLDAPETTL